jgi:hypothetical protein
MRRIDIMTASAATLAALGALIGYAIGSSGVPSTKVKHAPQPVDVRTEVIRKTVNVYRREHAAHGTGSGAESAVGTGAASRVGAAARTRASGTHATSPAPEAGVRTRTSGAAAPGGSTTRPPLRTATSGTTRSSAGSGSPVRTRTSGVGGAPSGRPLSTRSSGGGDGGDGNRHGGGHDD